MNETIKIPISETISALGEILASEGESAAIVVVGGTAMIVQGFVERATSDVDVIARAKDARRTGRRSIEPPEPLPEPLLRAIARVARDFSLPADWMNTTAGLQWKTGLPPGFTDRIHWSQYGGLWLGLADRYDLIMMKLYAAADGEGPASVHFQDLLALRPTNDELQSAAQWVRSQDTSPQFAAILDQVVEEATKGG
jgi:hypothetical protein